MPVSGWRRFGSSKGTGVGCAAQLTSKVSGPGRAVSRGWATISSSARELAATCSQAYPGLQSPLRLNGGWESSAVLGLPLLQTGLALELVVSLFRYEVELRAWEVSYPLSQTPSETCTKHPSFKLVSQEQSFPVLRLSQCLLPQPLFCNRNE